MFVPFERLIIKTNISDNEFLAKLADVTEAPKWLRNPFETDRKSFVGKIKANGFKLIKLPEPMIRNSFVPVIIGKIDHGVIEIHMRLHLFILIFMTLWLGMAAFFCVLLFTFATVSFFWIIPLMMFIMGYLLCTGSFKAEANNVRSFFEELSK